MWNSASPDGSELDTLHGGRFVVDVPKTRLPLAAAGSAGGEGGFGEFPRAFETRLADAGSFDSA